MKGIQLSRANSKHLFKQSVVEINNILHSFVRVSTYYCIINSTKIYYVLNRLNQTSIRIAELKQVLNS